MNRPKVLHVGGVLYWVIRTRNPDTQVLKDADSTPTIVIRKNNSSTGDSVTVTKRSATTGIYDCSYNPAGEVEGDEFTVEETAVVTGTTTTQQTYSTSWEFTVIAVERGTDGANTTAPANSTIANIYALVQLIDSDVSTMPVDVRNEVLNRLLAGNHDTTGSVGRLLQFLSSVILAQNANQRTVQVTGSNHISADVHEIQTSVLAKFASVNTGETTAIDGSVAKLSQGSGGNSGDATEANQLLIIEKLDDLSDIQLSSVSTSTGTISNFPEELIIGDSYDVNTGRIRVNITDVASGDPIDSLGSLEFSDATITFTAFRPNDSARIAGSCEYVREPVSGALTASYVLITLLTTETGKGKAEYTYEGRLKFVWEGPSSSDESDETQKTYKTTPFKFISNP